MHKHIHMIKQPFAKGEATTLTYLFSNDEVFPQDLIIQTIRFMIYFVESIPFWSSCSTRRWLFLGTMIRALTLTTATFPFYAIFICPDPRTNFICDLGSLCCDSKNQKGIC